MLIGLTISFLFTLGCSVGAFFAANAICQRQWKEKVPLPKLLGFTAIFVVVLFTLAVGMAFASTLVFGR